MVPDIDNRKPSIKERQWQLREEAILDAAQQMINAKGLAAMTLEDLIEDVGISKPTLYQHFKSKEDLFASLMTRVTRSSLAKLREFEEALPPGEALRAIIEWSVEARVAGKACPISGLCIVLSNLAQEPIRAFEKEFGEAVARLVERAQAEGTVSDQTPPILVAQMLTSISRDWTYKEIVDEGRTDVTTLKKSMVRMLLGEPKR